jgi:hypothetical protein
MANSIRVRPQTVFFYPDRRSRRFGNLNAAQLLALPIAQRLRRGLGQHQNPEWVNKHHLNEIIK